jgi:hypothetical protein
LTGTFHDFEFAQRLYVLLSVTTTDSSLCGEHSQTDS